MKVYGISFGVVAVYEVVGETPKTFKVAGRAGKVNKDQVYTDPHEALEIVREGKRVQLESLQKRTEQILEQLQHMETAQNAADPVEKYLELQAAVKEVRREQRYTSAPVTQG